MLGLVVLLVVVESFWQLQQVQALVHFFAGSTAAPLQEDGLDELTLGEWPDNHESPTADIEFRPPISIISQNMSKSPVTPSVDDSHMLFTQKVAGYKKTECHPDEPDIDPDPAD